MMISVIIVGKKTKKIEIFEKTEKTVHKISWTPSLRSSKFFFDFFFVDPTSTDYHAEFYADSEFI